MTQNFDLTTIWALILAFAVLMYVVMDGFDLGIGILFPFYKPGTERDQAMNAIAPVWDGNETWLVLGGGGLLAAFPLAYAIILTATYPLIMAMLLGLVFRGVAFEFRWRAYSHRAFWDLAFSGGSFVAALSQGIILGALLQGVHVEGRAYAGGWLDWLSPYSVLTGLRVLDGRQAEWQRAGSRLSPCARGCVGNLGGNGRRQPRHSVPGCALLPALVCDADAALP